MKNTAKAKGIIKLLKQGYSPKEITQRMDASYNYAWTLQKQMATEKAAAKAAKETILSVDNTVYPDITPEFAYSLSQGRQKRKEDEAIDELLNERGSKYGSFLGLSQVTQRLKAVAHNFAGQNNKTFDADQAEALDMIFTKIGRILNGDSNHIDSWIDIAGYATLVADRLQGKAR